MSPHPLVRWWALLVIVAGVAPLAWLVLVADGWTVNRLVVDIWDVIRSTGLPVTPFHTDVLLNTLMLLPFALLAGVGLPRVPWFVWWILGFLVSLGIEGAQYFMGTRDASLLDLVLNTVGAGAGALASHYLNRRLAAV